MNFKIGTCPHCGKIGRLVYSNNPLISNDKPTICFDCIKRQFKHDNLEHADFFCRTYNYSFNPEL